MTLKCLWCGGEKLEVVGTRSTVTIDESKCVYEVACRCLNCNIVLELHTSREIYGKVLARINQGLPGVPDELEAPPQDNQPPVKSTPKKVYISGPMSGYEEYNRPAFNRASQRITNNGNIPLNPAILPNGLTEPEYMDICIAMLRCADEMLMLPDWEKSAGARAEYAMGEKMGLPASFIRKVKGL